MKKIIVMGAVLAALSTNAFAKTEGNYAGVNLSYTRAKPEGLKNDSAIGYGLDYKYAVNMNNVFLAPGVFVERLNNSTKVAGTKNDLSYRFGAKLDLGYDVCKDLAVYVTGGIAGVKYKSTGEGEKVSGREYSAIYGAGLKYAVAKNTSVNFEYNRQRPKNSEVQTTINQFRVGVAYNF